MTNILDARIPLLHGGTSITLRDTYAAGDDVRVPVLSGRADHRANDLAGLPAYARVPVLSGQASLTVAEVIANAPGYHAGAVNFDAATNVHLANNAMSGPDRVYLCGYQWIKFDEDPSTTSMTLFLFDPNDTFGPYLQFNAAPGVTIQYSTDGAGGGTSFANYTPVLDQNWHLLCWTFGGATKQFLLDGVALTPALTGGSGGTIPISGKPLIIPNDSVTNAVGIDISLSDMAYWFRTSGIDWTDTTNLASVIVDGKPVDPSVSIALFGTPDVSFHGDASDWIAQAASQSFAVTGTPTDALTSPSD